MKQPTSARVNVVLPVYKPQLTTYEQIALTQCARVLGNYPILLAAPHSLDVSAYSQIAPSLQVRTFDDGYFNSIDGYNRLMLSEEFYKAFSDQEYLLIHQLDAFVFQDDLTYWCQQNYDYIGAPWLRDRDFTGWFDQLDFTLRQRVATWLNLKKADGITPREIINLNGVGNGGLTLRRVPNMLKQLKRFERKIAEYNQIAMHQYHEDVFWSIEVNRYWPRLRIPPYRKALHFSVEFYPEWAIEHYNHGKLPFGCHAWDIHGTDFWRPIFARYGYQI
ncbi:DUF5672 family protein [Spirosoma radiotolerans]|uniref:DUF5672 domain-containing protein n=1 Tax=Spirosoma radiotolerans TaxID=1379870 RepID=A0A0E3V6Z3_9BACT|nr:DUF5672 family protein [Spirosoma radiotolerans]AKD54976.1 hypothetical protein SD10_08730 [Spirosoma radiotolerans]